jgi:Pyruvate/2-oxoacid:ferredoxin oxidoreductase delta subunit
MPATNQPRLQVILQEGVPARPLAPAFRSEAIKTLLENGYAVSVARQAKPSECPAGLALLVLGDFAGQPPVSRDGVIYHDLAGLAGRQVGETAQAARTASGAPQPGAWEPWFPVIDYERCTNCMQCLSFCLFGVYGVDAENHIEAQAPDNCKVNCPACSRVCPEAAIMFPKYANGPINGDIVREADLGRETMKVDISALLGGDIYSMLRQRSEQAKVRFSKERDADQALKERMKCLSKLAEAGGIPAEVLMALPSPDEIQRRAEAAKARAQAALEKRGKG